MYQSTSTMLLVMGAIALFIHWLWSRRRLYKFTLTFPCTFWGLPLLGVFLQLGSVKNVLPFLREKWATSNARTFCVWLALTPIVFTSDPAVVEQVLTESVFQEKSKTFYVPVREALNGGMIALPAKQSLQHRKMLAPGISHKQLLSFVPTFNEKSLFLLKQLNGIYHAGGAANGLLQALREITFDIGRATTMGHKRDALQEDLGVIMQHLIFFFRHTFLEICLSCARLRWLIQYNPYLYYVNRRLKNTADKIITYRAKQTNDLKSDKEELLLIDLAYKFYRSGQLTWNDVIGEANGLLVAMYETTSSALYSTLMLLAMHPDIQQRAYEEIAAVISNERDDVRYEDLQHLKYLEMVINEALRLFPPAPLIGRQASQDTTLKIRNKAYNLPKHMEIVIDIFQLHRDTSLWGADAEQFNPDHFLPQNVADRSPYAFLPFSKGSRICFGWHYAYVEMKVMLVHLLSNYRFSTSSTYESVRLKISLFLEYIGEPLLQLHRRD